MEHPGLISSYDSEKKSLSLPIHKSASEGVIHYGHHSHSSTPPPGTVNKGGKVSMQGGIPVLVNSNPQARAVVIWCTFTCTCTTSKLLVHFHIKGRHMGQTCEQNTGLHQKAEVFECICYYPCVFALWCYCCDCPYLHDVPCTM